jgi:hypothetical protein
MKKVLAYFLLVAYVAQVPAQKVEESKLVKPLLSRERLYIKPTKIKKYILATIDQYKRCFITGPCTQQEVKTVQKDLKKALFALVFLSGSIYFLKQCAATQAAQGEQIPWYSFWRLLPAYYKSREQQARNVVSLMKMQKEHDQKIITLEQKVGDQTKNIKQISDAMAKQEKDQYESASDGEFESEEVGKEKQENLPHQAPSASASQSGSAMMSWVPLQLTKWIWGSYVD